jgi:hypothetical protein
MGYEYTVTIKCRIYHMMDQVHISALEERLVNERNELNLQEMVDIVSTDNCRDDYIHITAVHNPTNRQFITYDYDISLASIIAKVSPDKEILTPT